MCGCSCGSASRSTAVYRYPESDVAVTLVGVAFFLFLVWISQWFDRQPVRVAIGSLSKYSYAIFLVHHQVIMQVYTIVNPDSSAYPMLPTIRGGYVDYCGLVLDTFARDGCSSGVCIADVPKG